VSMPSRRNPVRRASRLRLPIAALVSAALLVTGTAQPAYAEPADAAPAAAIPNDDVVIESRLRNLLHPMLTVAQDTQVRALVRNAVSRQFDGDTNALLSTVVSEAEESFIVDPNAPEWVALKNGIAQFQNINGYAYEPQIYIPNQDEGVIPQDNVVMAVAPADEQAISTTGYTLDPNGQIRELDTPVTEAYAETYELWVLSVNEQIDTGGDTVVTTTQVADAEQAAGSDDARKEGGDAGVMAVCNPTGLRNNRGHEYLRQFRVPDPGSFGGLFEGKLEMKVIVIGSGGAIIRSAYFGKIKKKHLRNWQYPDLFLTSWDRAQLGDVWGYLWYEADGGSTISVTLNIKVIGSVTVSWQKRDDSAGDAPVWFTESTYQQYDTGSVEFNVCSTGGDGGTGYDNFARTGIAAASSTFPGYSPARVNDGSTNTGLGGEHSWANDWGTYPPNNPEWLQVDFGVDKTFRRVVVYTSEGYPIRDFDVQVWNGVTFVTVASVTNNTSLSVTLTFSARTSRLVRILGRSGPTHQPGYVRVNELEVYAV